MCDTGLANKYTYSGPEVVGGGEQDEAKKGEQHVVEGRAALIVLKVRLGHSLDVTGRGTDTEHSSPKTGQQFNTPSFFGPWALCNTRNNIESMNKKWKSTIQS